MKRHRVFKESPDILELGLRACNLLEKLRVKTVYGLARKTSEQLSAVKYYGGTKTRGEIESAMALIGLRPGMSVEDIDAFSPDMTQEEAITEAIRVGKTHIFRTV